MQPSEQPILVFPQYLRSPKARVFTAQFPSLQSVSVETGRKRRYPGLIGAAPDTRALYGAAAQLLGSARRVLDLGCGSGIGTAELRCSFDDVTAVDIDPVAVEFARAYLPSVAVSQHDGSFEGAVPAYDGICIVDVLGQSAAPAALLRTARRSLLAAGKLFIAEPRACPSQALMPPVVRAFSRPGLEHLLECAGLTPEAWFDAAGHFLVCVAQGTADDHFRFLAEADAALAAGQPEAALRAYARLPREASSALRTEALLGRARLFAARGELEAACQCVLEAAALRPESSRSLAGLAEVALMTGDATQSLELAIRALERDPCEVEAVQSLARAAENLQPGEAFATWRIANGLAPADLDTAIELSRLAAQRGEVPYAIWVLERLRDFRDDLSSDFHVTLSWLYLMAERLGDARLEAQLARVKDPQLDGAVSSGVSELWAQLES